MVQRTWPRLLLAGGLGAAAVAAGSRVFDPGTAFGALFVAGLFAIGLSSAAIQASRWWRRRGVEDETPLHGATAIPLALEHPYLVVRAAATESGRVTVLVDGVSKEISLAARQGFALGGMEQRTGDAAFDARVKVTGNSLACRSLLDATTRDAVREALDVFPGLSVNGGVVVWSGRPADVDDAARRLLEVGSRLLSPDLLAGLEKSALTDRSPVMRLRALDLLTSRFSAAPETRRIAGAALADTEASVRLRAALFLGPDGQDELAALGANESLPPEVRAEAVRGAVQLPRERAAEIVRGALTDRRELVRMSAILTVGRMKLAGCTSRLAGLVRRATPAMQLAIVEAAAATEHESAETPILAALQEGTPEAKLAAIRALGDVGTVRSIEPLLALRGSQIVVGALGPPAAAAVAAIQSRLAGAGAGQLAFAESAGGEISFPGAESGSLSVPPNEPGGLALSQDEVEGVRREIAARRRTT